ncbi:MAG: glycosyltransferase family 2 protein [Candidatus Nitrosopumilus sp. bin_7KS]
MQIVIPMAGRGKRFAEQGFSKPKPLIEINGKPMIQLVVENLCIDAQYTFVCQREHDQKYSVEDFLHYIKPNCNIIHLDEITDGPASTVLSAKKFINNDDELIIANSDQFVEWNSNNFVSYLRDKNADGGILTFEAYDSKWSFAKVNELGFVTEVAEKKPISNVATVGIYYYKKGKFFVEAAEQMIRKNILINNEFYVAPVYNEMIENGKKICTYNVKKMYGLGTPEDLDLYLKNYGDI